MSASSAGDHDGSNEARSTPPLPRSLKVLASLYLLVGGLAAIETIWAAFQGTFHFGGEAIAIALGIGLLRRSPAWRKLALWAALVQILVIGLEVYLFCRSGEEFADLSAELSEKIGTLFSKVVLGALAVLAAAVLVISVWSIRLLTRNEVKRAFQPLGNGKQRSGLLPALLLVLLLIMIARETGEVSLHYFKWSEEETQEEPRETIQIRLNVPEEEMVGEERNSLALPGFEAPCLIEVRGLGEQEYGVVATFNVERDFGPGYGSTSTHYDWKSQGARATSRLFPALVDSTDRIVVEVSKPQFSGEYWLPLFKQFTVEYRARIRGEGKYQSFRDEVRESRNVTVSGPCSVRDLKQHLLVQTKDKAINQILYRAKETAKHATQLMSKANVALVAEQDDRAIAIFNQAIGLDAKDAHAFHDRGVAWSHKKEYDKAIKDYDEAIRLGHAKIILSYQSRGNAWRAKIEYDKAIKDYDEAIRLDPKYSDAFNERGFTWLCKKEYDKAIKDYDEAIRIDSNRSRYFNNRGYAWTKKKEYDKAIEDYDEAIRIDPESVDAFLDRSSVWFRKKEYDKAIKDYNELIRLNPENASAFKDRGFAWLLKKEYDKAIKDFDEAIRLAPNYAPAFLGRGLAWSHKKEHGKAIKDYDKSAKCYDEAIREGERSPYAVLFGYFVAGQAGDAPAAQRFLKDSKGKLEETWPYPVVQFLRGEIDEKALLKLATDDDERTDARCFLGMHQASKGQKGQALAHFHWVKENGSPIHYTYAIAVAELERLERSADAPKR